VRSRHALRATPHGEKPMSVEEYERDGRVAKDRQLELWKEKGIAPQEAKKITKARGYND
jgi:sulfonate dioxygenase